MKEVERHSNGPRAFRDFDPGQLEEGVEVVYLNLPEALTFLLEPPEKPAAYYPQKRTVYP